MPKFFRSRWFRALSDDLNGAEVLNRLKHEDLSPKKKSKAEGGAEPSAHSVGRSEAEAQ